MTNSQTSIRNDIRVFITIFFPRFTISRIPHIFIAPLRDMIRNLRPKTLIVVITVPSMLKDMILKPCKLTRYDSTEVLPEARGPMRLMSIPDTKAVGDPGDQEQGLI
jgi:hypothetical protein